MKIAIFSYRSHGCGASIAAARLAKGLSELGHEVSYIYVEKRGGPSPIRGTDINEVFLMKHRWVRRMCFRILNFISVRTGVDFLTPFFYIHLKKVLRGIKPDIVNIHNVKFRHSKVAELADLWKVVWTMHDCYAFANYHYKITDYEGEEVVYQSAKGAIDDVERLCNHNASLLLVSPSEWLASEARKVVRGRKKVVVVNNGVPPQDIYPMDRKVARSLVGIPEDGFFVLFFASEMAWQRKNFTVLAKAMQEIEEPIQILAIGALKNNMKLNDDRFWFYPPVNNPMMVRAVYSAADVFCIPSVLDNLPNTVIESLLAGRPVLAADTGGTPEMISVGKNGWLFSPFDKDQLVQQLRDIYARRHADFCERPDQLRADAVKKYSHLRMAKDYEKIFREVDGGQLCR